MERKWSEGNNQLLGLASEKEPAACERESTARQTCLLQPNPVDLNQDSVQLHKLNKRNICYVSRSADVWQPDFNNIGSFWPSRKSAEYRKEQQWSLSLAETCPHFPDPPSPGESKENRSHVSSSQPTPDCLLQRNYFHPVVWSSLSEQKNLGTLELRLTGSKNKTFLIISSCFLFLRFLLLLWTFLMKKKNGLEIMA